MKSLGQRILSQRKRLNLSQIELSKRVGIAQPSLAAIESGRTKTKHIEILAKILNVTPEWLMFGVGQPTEDTQVTGAKEQIPLLNLEQAGQWKNSDHSKILSEVKEYIPHPGKAGRNAFAVRVKGDSMISPSGSALSFQEGDIVIVDPDRHPESGSFVIATHRLGTEATFKQYVVDAGVAYLKPLNPQYPLMPINEDMAIDGVVVGSVKWLV